MAYVRSPESHMAERAAAQEGARGKARRAPFPKGGWQGGKCPTGEARRDHLPQGWEPGRAGCSKRDLRQAQGLCAQAGWAQGLKKGEPGGLPGQP